MNKKVEIFEEETFNIIFRRLYSHFNVFHSHSMHPLVSLESYKNLFDLLVFIASPEGTDNSISFLR